MVMHQGQIRGDTGGMRQGAVSWITLSVRGEFWDIFALDTQPSRSPYPEDLDLCNCNILE